MSDRKSLEMDDQCELSLELLHLLKWFVEHDESTLKRIIQTAFRNGFRAELGKTQSEITGSNENTHLKHSIIDFLDLVDSLLHETINEDSVKTAYQKNLIPAINKIDGTSYDTQTLQNSLDKTVNQLENHPDENAKELLYKELLKRWKPINKKVLN